MSNSQINKTGYTILLHNCWQTIKILPITVESMKGMISQGNSKVSVYSKIP